METRVLQPTREALAEAADAEALADAALALAEPDLLAEPEPLVQPANARPAPAARAAVPATNDLLDTEFFMYFPSSTHYLHNHHYWIVSNVLLSLLKDISIST